MFRLLRIISRSYSQALDEDEGYERIGNPYLIYIILSVFIAIIWGANPLLMAGLLCVAIIIYTAINSKKEQKNGHPNANLRRRKNALATAQIFLKPYKDIWKNLTLQNRYCSLELGADGLTIIGKEIRSDYQPFRTFRITSSTIMDYHQLWDQFCISFAYNTHYEGLIELCERFRVNAIEAVITPGGSKVQPAEEKIRVEKTDINNASEIELTKLPGISIVIAKKIIKKREEIGGFKSLEEFFSHINIKQHLAEQLKPLIYIEKMKGSIQIKKNSERIIDL